MDLYNRRVTIRLAALSSGCLEPDCDLLLSPRPLVRHFICLGLPYFPYDVWAMFVAFKRGGRRQRTSEEEDGWRQLLGFLREKPLLLMHHILLPAML